MFWSVPVSKTWRNIDQRIMMHLIAREVWRAFSLAREVWRAFSPVRERRLISRLARERYRSH